jgi:hypothetical protein
MSATPTFDDFDVPPLADATRDLVIPVLLSSVNHNTSTFIANLLPPASIALDCPISA